MFVFNLIKIALLIVGIIFLISASVYFTADMKKEYEDYGILVDIMSVIGYIGASYVGILALRGILA